MKTAGIYDNVPINEYHTEEGISSTGISLLLDCPAKYEYEYRLKDDRLLPKDRYKAYLLGRALHMLVLEPRKFAETFHVLDKAVDLRTKEGRATYALAKIEAQDREILRLEEASEVISMAGAVNQHPVWAKLGDGKMEQSVYWDAGIYNTRLRARPDFFTDNIIIDVKTTDSIKNFARSVFSYGYYRQAAMQVDGLEAIDGKRRLFAFFVIEKKAPYLTACFTMDDESLERGRREYLEAAKLYSECLQSNTWPGYETQFQLITLPAWLSNKEDE